MRSIKLYLLVAAVTAAAVAVLANPAWTAGGPASPRFWQALIAFTLLGVACETSSLHRSFANVGASIAFIPLLASVALFEHPWPMLVAGVTTAIGESLVRRKPLIRVWFNTAQSMLALGLGGLVYRALGGLVSLERFSFAPLAFLGLVLIYFFVNSGSVGLAVAISSGTSVRESWSRVVGGDSAYDLFSSAVAVLLVFLYVNLQLGGVALLIVPLFFVRHVYRMNLQLQEELEEKLELMVKAIEARDPYTSGHSRRVAEYAAGIARELSLSARDVDSVMRAALLHDVGKIYEEFAPLLRNDGKLTPQEQMTMQTHAVRSAELISTVARLRGQVQQAIRHHHENFDGSGYPDGLARDQIPIAARIIMIADALDAMTTDRPYRKALSLGRAMEELEEYAGTQFDPDLVRLVALSPAIRSLLAPQELARAQVKSVGPTARPRPTWSQRIAQ
jgi:putative nucleotidyltransferase with HDIG domain